MKTGIWLILILCGLSSCESVGYGMLDNSIDADSFSVEIFEEQAANAPAGYGANFTEFLRDFLVSRSKMKLKNDKADIEITGKIKSYFTTPAAVQSDEVAALNSLKVSIEVSVINNKDEKQSFEKNFNQFSNYESSSDLSSVEDALLEDINEKLSQDILSQLSSNW
jgi:type II restriction/modification system DNA methylase subunit YeeA